VGGYLFVLALRRRRVGGSDHPHPHDHPHDHQHNPHKHLQNPHEHPHGHLHDQLHDHPNDHPPSDVTAPTTGRADGGLVVAIRPLDHSHGGRTHTHAPLQEGPLSWKAMVSMGVAGGLVPSPSALLVLLGATALEPAWFGVLLVIAYGMGMAVTLIIAGLLLPAGSGRAGPSQLGLGPLAALRCPAAADHRRRRLVAARPARPLNRLRPA
jgi:ABC-type nickel/cobalt efflux system permease component RcnA